jgi:hypothetical protein
VYQHQQETKRTQEIYSRKNPNGGETQKPFLDKFRSQRNYKQINPSSKAISTRNTITIATKTQCEDSAPLPRVVHKRERYQKD